MNFICDYHSIVMEEKNININSLQQLEILTKNTISEIALKVLRLIVGLVLLELS